MKPTPPLAVPDSGVRRTSEVFGNLAVLLCGASALAGALYFGIASCGGSVRHREIFRVAGVFLYVASLVLPSTLLPSLRSKIGFACVLPVGHVVLESAIAPFYPGPPTSLTDYGALFVHALVYGPCG